MIETYFEQSNSCENPNANKGKKIFFRILYYLFIVLGIFLILMTLYLPLPENATWYQVLIYILLWLLMPVSLFFGSFFIKKILNNINPVFDYVLNGREFYILRIYDNSKRKKFLQINVSQMAAIGKISLDSYTRYAADPNIKKIYALTNPQNEDNIYYMFFNDGIKKSLLHFEPNQECLMNIHRTIGRDIVSRT
ncbi:MAG TPA: hypothetical protein GX745_02655 [Clostridiales bacterium]|jgi:hypothetical protein|nr:hypothetical protein [Clostridiales bacterium]